MPVVPPAVPGPGSAGSGPIPHTEMGGRRMHRLVRLVLPLVVIAAVGGAFVVVSDSGNHTTTPYLSALSDAFATPAFANSCMFKACAGGSRHNIVCAKVTTTSSCTSYKGTCISGGCP